MTIHKIIREEAVKIGVIPSALIDECKIPRFVLARNAAMFRALEMKHTIFEIAKAFNRHHSTVRHAIKAEAKRLGVDYPHTELKKPGREKEPVMTCEGEVQGLEAAALVYGVKGSTISAHLNKYGDLSRLKKKEGRKVSDKERIDDLERELAEANTARENSKEKAQRFESLLAAERKLADDLANGYGQYFRDALVLYHKARGL